MCQIVVIDLPLQRHMLSHPDYHIMRRGHIHYWRLARIGRGNPYCDWEFVLRAAKGDGQRPREEEKQRGETGFVGCKGQKSNQQLFNSNPIRAAETYCRHQFVVRGMGIGPGHWRRRSRSDWGLDMFGWGRSGPVEVSTACLNR